MEVSNHDTEHCSNVPGIILTPFPISVWLKLLWILVLISDRVNLDYESPWTGLGLGRHLGTSVELHTQYHPAFDIQPPSNAP